MRGDERADKPSMTWVRGEEYGRHGMPGHVFRAVRLLMTTRPSVMYADYRPFVLLLLLFSP